MRCDKIRDILLADYTDGEAEERLVREVEEHLSGCAECREFYSILKDSAVSPFKGLKPMEAPPEVWEGVKDKIEKRSAPDKRTALLEVLYGLLPGRSLVLAAAGFTLAVFLLTGAHVWRIFDRDLVVRYAESQLYYFSEEDSEGDSVNGEGFETAVEKYLL